MLRLLTYCENNGERHAYAVNERNMQIQWFYTTSKRSLGRTPLSTHIFGRTHALAVYGQYATVQDASSLHTFLRTFENDLFIFVENECHSDTWSSSAISEYDVRRLPSRYPTSRICQSWTAQRKYCMCFVSIGKNGTTSPQKLQKLQFCTTDAGPHKLVSFSLQIAVKSKSFLQVSDAHSISKR